MKTRTRFCYGAGFLHDLNYCVPQNNYAQLDTTSAYNAFINPLRMIIFQTWDGTSAIYKSESREEFIFALKALKKFQKRNNYWGGIDAAGNTKIKEAFQKLGLSNMLKR